MKFNFNAHRLAHFCILALFSWVGGQWLLVSAGWTQPWMAYSVSCTAVTQFSNLVLKLLLVKEDKEAEKEEHQDKDATENESYTKGRSVNNKKNKKKKAAATTSGKRDVTE